MVKTINIIITLFIFASFINAQDRYGSLTTWVKSIPEYGYSSMKYSATQKTNLLILGAAGLGAILAHQHDYQFQDFAQREKLLPDRVSRFGDLYGGIWSAWLLPVSIIVTSKAANESNRKMLEKMEFATSAMVANGITTIILKELTNRRRPNGKSNRSMPSWHTSHSFTVATVANELFGTKVGIVTYLIAGMVAVSRINDNEHYLSDVIIGAGLGTAIGRGFAKTYKENIYMPNMSIGFTFNF